MPNFFQSLSRGPLGFGGDLLKEMEGLPPYGAMASGAIRRAIPGIRNLLSRLRPRQGVASGLEQAATQVRPGYSSIPENLSGIGEAQRPWVGVKPITAAEGTAARVVPQSYKQPKTYDLTEFGSQDVMSYLANLRDEGVDQGLSLREKLMRIPFNKVDLNDPAFLRNAELFRSIGY